MEKLFGYHGVILEIDLTSGKIDKKPLSPEDVRKFVGGRGLGMKILWDRLKKTRTQSPFPGKSFDLYDRPLLWLAGSLGFKSLRCH